MKSKYRYLVPNGITFASLACGIISILLAASGQLKAASYLILASYVLDLFDGASARYLEAGSEFGLQLDSLVDMVSLGTAPAVLAFMHMTSVDIAAPWIWSTTVLFPLAGAYRLARFNLLPPKKSGSGDSVGLTITSAGATIALSVLAATAPPLKMMPNIPSFWFVVMILATCILMVSRIPFPSFLGVFSSKQKNAVLLVLFGISILLTPTFFNAWFFWNSTYLGVSIAQASYKSLQ
ncbi:MAG: CDP-alcohol phosphatidyltransferase family protein [Chloroflexota bacterium]